MNEEEIKNKTIDELYFHYESIESLKMCVYIHPMFYNGTFSKNNECQPEEPEPLMTREEFVDKLLTQNSEWLLPFQVLYCYISKQNENNS